MYETLVPVGKNLLQVGMADSFGARFMGLMGKERSKENHALLLLPCSSIHMLFMRFPIDAVFFDEQWTVLKVAENLQPWTGHSVCKGAYACLELPANSAFFYGFFEGRRIPMRSMPDPEL